MSYKKGLSIGVINIPIQVLSALAANVIIINQIGKDNLDIWYLLISTMPLFTALELSFPSLMLKNLNKKVKTKRVIRNYVLKAVLLSTFLQFIVISCIMVSIGFKEISIWLFFIGAYLRSISNIIISVPYSKGFIVLEKIYRVSFSSLLPVIVLALFTYFGVLKLSWLYLVWVISSSAVFIFSLWTYNSSNRELIITEHCDENIELKFKDNMSLLVTTIPGLFIFNLSIYYLKAYSSSSDIVTYGFILQLVNVFYLVNNIIPSVFAPQLSKSYYAGKRITTDILKILDCNVCIAIISFIFIFFLGENILALLFSTGFDMDDIRSILFCVSLFVLIESIQVTLTYLGISTGKYNYHYQSLCSALFVTLLSYYLIPQYGYLGLVYAVCSAQVMTCLPFNIYIVCRHFGLEIKIVLMRFLLLLASFLLLFFSQRFFGVLDFNLKLLMFFITLTITLLLMYKVVVKKIIR